jgi:excisionase family DNA binding protein
LVSREDLAERLGLTVRTLKRLTLEHRIPHYRITTQIVLYDPDEVRAWLQERKRNPVTFDQPASGT